MFCRFLSIYDGTVIACPNVFNIVRTRREVIEAFEDKDQDQKPKVHNIEYGEVTTSTRSAHSKAQGNIVEH